MKKITILILALLLLSAQLPADQRAYYASPSFGPVLLYNTLTPLDASFFVTKQDGIVTLSGFQFVPTPGYTGLITVSGACTLKHDPVYFALVLQVNGNSGGYLAQGYDTTESFTMTMPATGPFVILAYELNPNVANAIKCVILFEAV